MRATATPTRNTPDVIAEALIAEIRGGVFAPATPLPTERELCERFAASRPTVREALAQLQMRGYAEAGAGKRPRAALPSITSILKGTGDHIREILGDTESGAHLEQMRQFIETGAAREAAKRADNAQLSKLQSALEDNFAAIGTACFATTDIAFHRALVAVVGNPVILALHDMFVSTMIAHRPPTDDARRYDQIAYEEHRELYQAILNGEVLAATDVMDRHLTRSYRARLQVPKITTAAKDQPTG
ncbi:FCD domain-containing protein [Thalassorhabdomicrobium marinisediminis]|uniref:Transcriptional regulator n=1 Tax=Thalassorhabdomicrobium marinisediminis TaxID=2170577 RepID=A0A2T7FUP8_9RHOB|nr:FCD domain-containing protein [Thalassorhabdomicrobium marinisediminis]PVA05886.1 transcriptional regulator [Thalassorhabdomicrobium marinisediminis]